MILIQTLKQDLQIKIDSNSYLFNDFYEFLINNYFEYENYMCYVASDQNYSMEIDNILMNKDFSDFEKIDAINNLGVLNCAFINMQTKNCYIIKDGVVIHLFV